MRKPLVARVRDGDLAADAGRSETLTTKDFAYNRIHGVWTKKARTLEDADQLPESPLPWSWRSDGGLRASRTRKFFIA